MKMELKDLNDWKDRWNNGDVKFVPELFELAEQQQEEIRRLDKVIDKKEQELERLR